MNKRLLFLVAVLSLGLLSVSFAALGTTSTTADVNIAVNEYAEIIWQGDGVLDFGTIEDLTKDGDWAAKEYFTIKTNHTVTLTLTPKWFIPCGSELPSSHPYYESCTTFDNDLTGDDIMIFFNTMPPPSWGSGAYVTEIDFPPGEHTHEMDSELYNGYWESTDFSNYHPNMQLKNKPGSYTFDKAITLTVS